MSETAYLTRIFWAVIVLIAVQFAPAVALAHSGHSHERISVSSEPANGPEVHKAGVALPGMRHDAELRNSHQTLAGKTDGSGICVGGCCGSGMACCGAALNADPFSNLLPPLGSLRTTLLNAPNQSGIDPQALRKPPRSFA
jgi:hypothetical protein